MYRLFETDKFSRSLQQDFGGLVSEFVGEAGDFVKLLDLSFDVVWQHIFSVTISIHIVAENSKNVTLYRIIQKGHNLYHETDRSYYRAHTAHQR